MRETAAATGLVMCDLFLGLEVIVLARNRPLLSGFELVKWELSAGCGTRKKARSRQQQMEMLQSAAGDTC